MAAVTTDDPGWLRLWRHSYRLGLRWLARGARNGWKGRRVGLQRLLVPLDPWRYYELGRVAEQPFDGRCLDVSSPKLLMSLLQHEGRGRSEERRVGKACGCGGAPVDRTQ